tara:strand:- start:60 stop:1928 length:1869 start_codon:yes stop_codon:yes gene_type:complete
MELNKYYGEDGLVIDPVLGFTSSSKDISDLIKEMNDNGLLVSVIDMSGDVIRVAVKGTGQSRPDKPNSGERSGWYSFFQTGTYQSCTYSNWRENITYKWVNTDVNKLSSTEQNQLKAQIQEAQERANDEKIKRQNEVADDCANRFSNAEEISEHKYLTYKKIKSYGLKGIKDSLVVPLYNSNIAVKPEIRSLQYITPKSKKSTEDFIKRFVSASEVSGSVFHIGFDWEQFGQLEKLIICEGYADGVSIYEATQLPTLVVFSANFGMKALLNIRKFCNAQLILAYDNDKTGIGLKKAEEIHQAIPNCVVRIPSEQGDYNDLHQKYGLDRVRAELIESKFNIKQYSIKKLVGEPKEIKFLVDKFIPLGSPGILASIGGVGKSYSMIQLAVAIATGGKWWGKEIKEQGSSVIFCAEDSQDEIHRRIAMLDPEGKRFNYNNEVYIFPVPEQKEPLILLREEGITTQAQELVEELKTISNLKMVCFDPLQAFTTASISQSNEAGQMWGSYCSQISARLGVTTLTTHHLNKGALSNDSNDSLSHRQEIRGASSIVDSMRFALAMWLADEETCTQICLDKGIEFNRMSVVKAGVVKSNSGDIDYSVQTLFRKNAVLEPIENTSGGINWD